MLLHTYYLLHNCSPWPGWCNLMLAATGEQLSGDSLWSPVSVCHACCLEPKQARLLQCCMEPKQEALGNFIWLQLILSQKSCLWWVLDHLLSSLQYTYMLLHTYYLLHNRSPWLLQRPPLLLLIAGWFIDQPHHAYCCIESLQGIRLVTWPFNLKFPPWICDWPTNQKARFWIRSCDWSPATNSWRKF